MLHQQKPLKLVDLTEQSQLARCGHFDFGSASQHRIGPLRD
jgi:hypothetical protein